MAQRLRDPNSIRNRNKKKQASTDIFLVNMGLVPARVFFHKALGTCPFERLRIRRQVAEMLQEEASVP